MWSQIAYNAKFSLHILLFMFKFWKSILIQIAIHSNKTLKGKIVDIVELTFSTSNNSKKEELVKKRQSKECSKNGNFKKRKI